MQKSTPSVGAREELSLRDLNKKQVSSTPVIIASFFTEIFGDMSSIIINS